MSRRMCKSSRLLLALLRLLDLRDLDLLGRNRLAHDDVPGRRARNPALEDEQMVLRVDAKHPEIANRHAPAAHAAGSTHPLHDTRRERRGANRSRGTVEHRTVRRGAAGKMM